MAISASIKAKLNKMNRAAKDALLGDVIHSLQSGSITLLGLISVSGSHVVTVSEMSASRVPIIDTEMSVGKIWQVVRSGSDVSAQVKELAWVKASGCLVLAGIGGDSSGSLITGDVVTYMGF